MSDSQVETGNVLLDSNSEHRVLRSTLQNDQLLEDCTPCTRRGVNLLDGAPAQLAGQYCIYLNNLGLLAVANWHWARATFPLLDYALKPRPRGTADVPDMMSGSVGQS